jgi:hypothetical protein
MNPSNSRDRFYFTITTVSNTHYVFEKVTNFTSRVQIKVVYTSHKRQSRNININMELYL